MKSAPLQTLSLDRLYDKYAPAYFGAACRELYSTKLAEEVICGAFQDMAGRLSEFDPSKTTQFAWGFRFVRAQIYRAKTELALKEIFGCRQPEAYRSNRSSASQTMMQHA